MESDRTERKKQHRRSKRERRQIVEESLEAGTSVSLVARAHGVNANQVFAWRKLYREGQLEVEGAVNELLPVKVPETSEDRRRRSKNPARATASGTIDIDLGHARVRIQGAADPACVRAALEGLVR